MATIQTINIGTNPNDNTGDDLRAGGQKINDNFSALNNDVRFTDNRTPTDTSVTYGKVATDLTQRVSVSASEIDWSGGGIYTKTLSANTTFTFSNLKLNKVITLLVSGNYSLSLPAYCKKISGTYDGAVTNYIQLHCTNASGGSEEVWYSIAKQAT